MQSFFQKLILETDNSIWKHYLPEESHAKIKYTDDS